MTLYIGVDGIVIQLLLKLWLQELVMVMMKNYKDVVMNVLLVVN
jgi:hypothetical protein